MTTFRERKEMLLAGLSREQRARAERKTADHLLNVDPAGIGDDGVTLGVLQIYRDEILAESPPSSNGSRPAKRDRVDQGGEVKFEEVEPWPEPVDGSGLLDQMGEVIGRYVVIPKHAARAVALWCLSTWAMRAFDVAAILCISSVVKRCGKTSLQRIVRHLVRRPLPAGNISPSGLFRIIERDGPTVLLDEADAYLKDNEALRCLLNAGISRGDAFVIRTVGDDHEPRQFSVFGAKSIALIGKLHGTLADRSLPVRMERKTRTEKVSRFRERDAAATFGPLKRKMARWADDNVDALAGAEVSAPEALNDRAADLWEPLLGIAVLAGGAWPERARAAAVALSGDGKVPDDESKILLLSDLQEVLTDPERCPKGRIASKTLAEMLAGIEDRPWGAWGRHGKPITPNQVAALLSGFEGVAPKTVRGLPEDGRLRGYDLEACRDAFERYLTSLNGEDVTTRAGVGEIDSSEGVTRGGASRIENDGSGAPVSQSHGVTAQTGVQGGGESEAECGDCGGRMLRWSSEMVCTVCKRRVPAAGGAVHA